MHYSEKLPIKKEKNCIQTKEFSSLVVIPTKNKLDISNSDHYILLNLSEIKHSFKSVWEFLLTSKAE